MITWEQCKAKDLFKEYIDKGYPELSVLSASQEFGMVKRSNMGINISHDKSNEIGYKRVLPGQFVIHLRSFQGGFAHSAEEGITSPAYTVLGFKESEKHCDYFWKYIFNSEEFINRLKTVTYGIRDGRSISYNEFLTMEFLFPSYDEQKQISDYLRNLDNLITLHQCKFLMLKRLKTINFWKVKHYKSTTTWEQRKLSDITFLSGEKNKSNLSYESFSISNEKGFVPQNEQFEHGGIMRDADKSMYYIVSPKSFAYNPARINVGSIGYYDMPKNVIVSSLYEVFKTTEEVNDRFLWHWFKSNIFQKMIEQYQEGGVRLYFYYDKLCMCSMSLPSLDEQVRIGAILDNLDNLITLHQCKLKKLKNLKIALQQQFFVNNQTNFYQKGEKNMTFKRESDFEEALIKILSDKGWEKEVIKHPTEKVLIDNWAKILFENNRGIDRLNNSPLTYGEMQQIIEQITTLRTPLKLNGFINGKSVSIKRDNPDDKLHFGKEVSLKIYDRREIAAGQSRYQIVQQPEFASKSKILNNRRGDLMLLINGMPVIHIELKRSGVPISQACEQIKKYANEGIFTGLFSLVQIFVAMNPDETKYFANPGLDGKFNEDYFFHWADFNNEPINNWKDIASSLLSIPMAHQLIGFYTVADNSDGILKVMRSYQYYAASAISDKVAKTKWDEENQRGGYIWHTTGSGKTMTSFKSAQLIANSNDADKVVFLTDRIELGTQSLKEYRGFAEDNESVQATENTQVLISKLRSSDPNEILIVTSIQKMSNIKDEENGLNSNDIEIINDKRLVFIVDEAHRSTFGDMLITIKNTFPNAIFFGFTGTPIHEENQKKMNTTATIFGNELHRYSIADGIRDKNVLGFDPYKVLTFKDRDVRRVVALDKAKAKTVEEALVDSKKAKIYNKYMNEVKMYGYVEDDGKDIKGIEDCLPKAQYLTEEHQNKVVEDITTNWVDLSRNSKFHAIFATSSIHEAITYYRLIKKVMPNLKTTCLFDPNIDNTEGFEFKEDGLVEIIKDYNERYEQYFTLATHASFKKDIALRLAHKEHYKFIEKTPEKQLDLLIVVDQMLTGFDSKWVNTLYMDKILEYENIIQAFSRTNRLFGPEKPFGTIRYYRKPHTMENYINLAVKLYSGDKPIALFADKLPHNLEKMNEIFEQIKELFRNEGIKNFNKLPDDKTVIAKFASLFKDFNDYLEAAKIQGFKWKKTKYEFKNADTGENIIIEMNLNELTYLVLLQRYKEIQHEPGESSDGDIPYDLVGYITEIDTEKIDADYMNSRFEKYLKELEKGSSKEVIEQALSELHRSFATLNQYEQKFANIFLHDVQSGKVFDEVLLEKGKTLKDYIIEYQYKDRNDQIHRFAKALGICEEKLRDMMDLKLTETNINEFGRLDELKKTVDKAKAKQFFEKKEGIKLNPPKVNIRTDKLLRKFIFSGGFEVENL